MPNDRSTERLLQRKQIADEAGKAHPGEWGTDIRYNLKMSAVCADNGEPLCIMTDDEDVATATHIALSDPGTTQQDIDEIIRLRQENERLRGEVESLNKQADWLALRLWGTGSVPPVENVDVRACRTKMWREAARNAVEESA